jgi:hypothetical protein
MVLSDRHLIGGIESDERRGQKLGNIRNRFSHTFAEVAGFVAIAQLDRLVLAGAGSARNGSAAYGSASEFDIGFNSGIATGIENLPGTDGKNGCFGHGGFNG